LNARLVMPLLAALGVGAALVPASAADEPARASAEAAVATGALGTVAPVRAQGDDRRSRETRRGRPELELSTGDASAEASRSGGRGQARASAVARSVSLFDGLVTAYGVRRTATARGGDVEYAGRVAGLRIAGRLIGDVTRERSFDVAGARVTANRDGAGLTVTLTAPRGRHPVGATVVVADVAADADDAAPVTEPRPRSTAPESERREQRREAETAERRLTRRGFGFPVYGGASVADDFGAARQIGAHQGNDVFAPFGAPVLAVADGVVEKVGTLPISGNRLWLRTADGDEFFYAHLSAFSPAAVNGRRVEAGTVLGFTGNTGDAEPTPPHVHFEIHPDGGDAIDPHAILLAWQERDAPAGGWLRRFGSDTAARPGALVEVRDFIAER
jgi:hypothetical protein